MREPGRDALEASRKKGSRRKGRPPGSRPLGQATVLPWCPSGRAPRDLDDTCPGGRRARRTPGLLSVRVPKSPACSGRGNPSRGVSHPQSPQGSPPPRTPGSGLLRSRGRGGRRPPAYPQRIQPGSRAPWPGPPRGRPSSSSFSSGPSPGLVAVGESLRLARLGLGPAAASWCGARGQPGAGGGGGSGSERGSSARAGACWPARWPSRQSAGRRWSHTSGRSPRPSGLPAGLLGGGCGAQPMGGRGADNTPDPACRPRLSLAGRVRGGPGGGRTWRAGEVHGWRRQRVCLVRPPARLRRGEAAGCARCGDGGAGAGSPGPDGGLCRGGNLRA